MPSQKILTEAANKVFCQRVAFIAFQVASKVAGESPDTPNHLERAHYAEHIFRGEEKALLLTMHVVASSPEICALLEEGGQDTVGDDMLTAAVEAVWEPRAMACGAIHSEVQRVRELAVQTGQISQELATTRERMMVANSPANPGGIATE